MNAGFWEFSFGIWTSGGLLMVPLFFLGVMVFASSAQLMAYMQRQDLPPTTSPDLTRYVREPENAPAGYRRILGYVSDSDWSEKTIQARFDEVNIAILSVVDRRIQYLKTLVAAAPLTGLLGTVMGMLVTFAGISQSTGQTVDKVAYGISQALITTQTGLMIALPGLFVILIVQRRKHKLEASLSKLRSIVLSTLTPT